MKEEIALRWIERLRSGEIPQGQGVLGMADGRRCCLGVACDIAVEDGVILPPTNSDGVLALRYDVSLHLLPSAVMYWAEANSSGMTLWFPSVIDSPEYVTNFSLAELNDDGFTFDQIADVIERFWPWL